MVDFCFGVWVSFGVSVGVGVVGLLRVCCTLDFSIGWCWC